MVCGGGGSGNNLIISYDVVLQVDKYMKEILCDLIENLNSNLWRVRQSRYDTILPNVVSLSLVVFLHIMRRVKKTKLKFLGQICWISRLLC